MTPRHGFTSPFERWLRESVGDEVERRYAADGPLAELVAPSAVARLVGEHRAERADHKAVLFCLLELSQWHRTFIEGAAPVMAEVAGP